MHRFNTLKHLSSFVTFIFLVVLGNYCHAATMPTSHVIYYQPYDYTGGGFAASSFSQDGSLFGTIGLGQDLFSLRIWKTRNSALFSALKIPRLQNFAISPDNKNVAVIMGARQRRGLSYPYAVWIRDIHTGETKRELVKMGTVDAAFYSIIYSRDGKCIAADSGNSLIHVWNAATGKQIALFRIDGFATAIAFSPDGKRLAALTGGYKGKPQLSVWSISPKRLLHSVKTDTDLDSLAYSPDGKHLVANGFKKLTMLFNAQTLKLQQQLSRGHILEGENGQTVFSPDGRYIALARDNFITVRGVPKLKNVIVQFPGVNAAALDTFPELLAIHFISSKKLIWAIRTYEDKYKITLWQATF